jgi:hypothetical protein
MSKFLKKLWHRIKTKGVDIGRSFLGIAFSVLIPIVKYLYELWYDIKIRGETIGIKFIIFGFVAMIVSSVTSAGEPTKSNLATIGLALIAVGLGFISIGVSTKSDKRQTDLLEKLNENVARLPLLFNGDILTPSGHSAVKEFLEGQSKEAAQKRLAEDYRRFGYVRGELFQNKDGSWSIHWGDKYPL